MWAGRCVGVEGMGVVADGWGVEGMMGVVADVWEVLLGVFSVVNRGDGVATSHTLSWGS